MKLFYFKEKLRTHLRHAGKNMKNTFFSEKTYENKRIWEKHIQYAERLSEKLQKYPWLYEKGNKRYEERNRKENAWRAIEQFLKIFFIENKEPNHTLKTRTFFFITCAKKFITWNAILYHWHSSPAINYGKLLVLFFFKIFPAPTLFLFSFGLLLMIV